MIVNQIDELLRPVQRRVSEQVVIALFIPVRMMSVEVSRADNVAGCGFLGCGVLLGEAEVGFEFFKSTVMFNRVINVVETDSQVGEGEIDGSNVGGVNRYGGPAS